jgi:hypothetical protein
MNTKKLYIGVILVMSLFFVIVLGKGKTNADENDYAFINITSASNVKVTDMWGQNVAIVQNSSAANINPTQTLLTDSSIKGHTHNGILYDTVQAGTSSDSKYAYSFKISNSTQMVYWFDPSLVANTDYITEKRNNASYPRHQYILPKNNKPNGKCGFYIYNVGTFVNTDTGQASNINLKVTFSWEPVKFKKSGATNDIYPILGITDGKNHNELWFAYIGLSYCAKIEIYTGDPADPANSQLTPINMSTYLKDIDALQYYGLGNFNGDSDASHLSNYVNKVEYTSDCRVFTDVTPDSHYDHYLWFYAEKTVYSETDIKSTVRVELESIYSMDFIIGADMGARTI